MVADAAGDESGAPGESSGLDEAASWAAELSDADVPAEPGESSAHASPPLHPHTMATPTPRATAKPPIRPMYASLGMRYV